MDRHGRVFYIDHKNRTTTWKKPEPGQAVASHGDVVSRSADDMPGKLIQFG